MAIGTLNNLCGRKIRHKIAKPVDKEKSHANIKAPGGAMSDTYSTLNKKTNKIEVYQNGKKSEFDQEPSKWESFKESIGPTMIGTPQAEADAMRRRLKKARGE